MFFMQKKDQTFTKFCEFKALVEKDSGSKVKALQSDNGVLRNLLHNINNY